MQGDIVRYGPNRIAINTPSALHEIYSVRSSVQKSSLYAVFQRFFKVAGSGSIIDKAEHASRRRIISQTVTVPVLKSMEVFVLDNVQRFCEQLAGAESEAREEEWSPGRDMTDWVARMAIDIIGGLFLGQSWITLDENSKREFVESIPAGTKGFLMVKSFADPDEHLRAWSANKIYQGWTYARDPNVETRPHLPSPPNKSSPQIRIHDQSAVGSALDQIPCERS